MVRQITDNHGEFNVVTAGCAWHAHETLNWDADSMVSDCG